MAPHSSTLAWKIPWMEEPGRLLSLGSPRVRHDWATSLSLFTFLHWRRRWQPTPVFLPGESQEWGAWWAAVYGVAQSQTQTEAMWQQQQQWHKMWSISSSVYFISVFSLVRCLLRSLTPFKSGCFFIVEIWVPSLHILAAILLYIYILQMFLPVCGLSFHSLDIIFSEKILILMKSNFSTDTLWFFWTSKDHTIYWQLR